METASRESQAGAINTNELVYCPHLRGINLKLSGECGNEEQFGDRRNAATDTPADRNKRWLNAKVCQHYLSRECPYIKYPALRQVKGLINTLCNSKSILELTK